MRPTSGKEIKILLRKYRIHPSKRLGQNFLINKGVIKKFIAAADLNPKDIVLEVGPGLGTLTQELTKRTGKVLAVEKDPKMIEVLKETLKDFSNIEVVQEDILKFPVSKFKTRIPKNYKVAGNLPFYLTAPVIRMFLEAVKTSPKSMILVVQKEVGERICAKPKKMSILAVSVQFYAKAEIISFISKQYFWPQPKVDSAIIKISNIKKPKINRSLFFKVVKAGFSQPRKQLINNLSRSLKIDQEKTKTWLLENGVQPSQRAETLKIKNWLKLAADLRKIDCEL